MSAGTLHSSHSLLLCREEKSDRMIESIAQWKEKPMVSRCVMFVIQRSDMLQQNKGGNMIDYFHFLEVLSSL